MYGTVMIGKLKPGQQAEWTKSQEDWKTERNAHGHVTTHTLFGDDGVTVAMCVVFDSKDAYWAVANDPEQDRWWQQRATPLLDGDVQWTDGTWAD
jgi:antibiotic biosynthesis monooxygenase (ABM) superfamily enzyme